ncbi:MAG: hypothetical protein GXP08_10520, partial [Gammaproteobacteria bacterium]|nr:hypothetical protein [Gammaproteobacteria bacterium]
GFHAEVLAVNEMLNTYFKGETDPAVLNKVSVATYRLKNAKKKGVIPFDACANCKAILKHKARVITDRQTNQ